MGLPEWNPSHHPLSSPRKRKGKNDILSYPKLGENAHMFFITLITVIAAIFSKVTISQHSLRWTEGG